MPKKSNIAGVRFGSLVDVEPTDNRQNGYTIWTLGRVDGGIAPSAPHRIPDLRLSRIRLFTRLID